MTVLDWISVHRHGAPPALVERTLTVLRETGESANADVCDALLAASDALLRRVLVDRAPGEARTAALDLLAADACVTWAFEAAADAPATLAARAEAAMRRITEAAA